MSLSVQEYDLYILGRCHSISLFWITLIILKKLISIKNQI